MNDLSFYIMKLERQGKVISEISRIQEIIEIEAEIMRQNIEKQRTTNTTKSWFYEKISKLTTSTWADEGTWREDVR